MTASLSEDPVALIGKLRRAVADYISSEGCGCCSNAEKHEKHKARLARILGVPQYQDGSGYDFGRFRTPEKRRGRR